MLLTSNCYSQKDSIFVDTSYHTNGTINILQELNVSHWMNDGKYIEFDSLGNKLKEGVFRFYEKIECINCYEKYGEKLDSIDLFAIPAGEWKYYHPNGQLKEIGSYADKVHVYFGSREPLISTNFSGPINTWIAYDSLKQGTWYYYDESGFNYLRNEYHLDDLTYELKRYPEADE